MATASNSNYYIPSGTVEITPNLYSNPRFVGVSVGGGVKIYLDSSANAAMFVVLGLSGIVSWSLTGTSVILNADYEAEEVYIYARILKDGDSAQITFSNMEIDGTLATDESDESYLLVKLGKLSAPNVNNKRTLESFDTGALDISADESITLADVQECIEANNRSMSEGLSAAGIDIENGKIEQKVDKFSIKNADNEQVLGADEDGNISVTGTIRAKVLYQGFHTLYFHNVGATSGYVDTIDLNEPADNGEPYGSLFWMDSKCHASIDKDTPCAQMLSSEQKAVLWLPAPETCIGKVIEIVFPGAMNDGTLRRCPVLLKSYRKNGNEDDEGGLLYHIEHGAVIGAEGGGEFVLMGKSSDDMNGKVRMVSAVMSVPTELRTEYGNTHAMWVIIESTLCSWIL